MNYKKLTNTELETEIASSGTIAIFELNESDLTTIGYLDSNGWPSGYFIQIMSDLEKISPTLFESEVKFWDPITGGFSVYNKFIEENEND